MSGDSRLHTTEGAGHLIMKTAINYLLGHLETANRDLVFYRDGKNKRGFVDLSDDLRKEESARLTSEIEELRAAIKLLETADD